MVNPNVTIPYWDWSIGWDAPENTRALSNYMFGGNGIGPDKCLLDGFQASWMKSFPNYSCITRNYKQGNSPGSFWPEEAVINISKASNTFSDFSPNIENGCHGVVHLGVGGDMMEMWAPTDVLFFMHHSMIDLVWASWQRLDPKNMYDINSLSITRESITLDSLLPYYNDPIRSVIDITSLGSCYTYSKFLGSSTSPTRSGLSQTGVGASIPGRNNTRGYNTSFPRRRLPVPIMELPINNHMKAYDPVIVGRLNEFVRKEIEKMEKHLDILQN